MVLIACAQMCSTDNVAHNLAMSVQIARDAAAAGAKALFLPEASDYIANDAHLGYLLAQPLATHTYTLGLQAVAKELGIYINAGIHERPSPDEAASEEPGSERVFNTHVSIGPDGKVKAFYRKLHLFDVQLKDDSAEAIPGEKLPRTGEHKKIIPGSVIPEPVDMGAIGRVGLEICYDIRFPELHIILRRKGADIITLPSAFTVPTGRAHWYTLVRSVAINYQVYVIAATQAGAHSTQRSSWGEALVFDPWGVELGRLPSIDETENPTQPMPPRFILADVDLARVESVREQIPLEIQKREDIYGVVGANTFVGSSSVAETQPLGVLEHVWQGLKRLFGYGYGSVRLPCETSTETVAAAGVGASKGIPLARTRGCTPTDHKYVKSQSRVFRCTGARDEELKIPARAAPRVRSLLPVHKSHPHLNVRALARVPMKRL
ncbi:Nitrilase-like protein [Mycena venus]|uniref:Nitrilase-like protein n=1 Tax=Mycena venus TaxID=2733690 RepID=A0A8H6WX76_9AGAR|nr:Nitrilase-like protein [Mycena venus]